MHIRLLRKIIRSERVLILVLILCVSREAEGTSLYLKPWKDVYQILYPGEDPQWSSLSDVRAWADSERDRLEPLVLEVLRGERSNKTWSDLLFVARVIPTQEIRDVLLARIQDFVQKYDEEPLKRMSPDAAVLAIAIDIFADAKDARIRPVVLDLIVIDNQAYELVEHCIDALRVLGDEKSIPALGAIRQREKDVHMDRRCAMAAKVIKARADGVDLLGDAQEKLRSLLQAFARACRERNVQEYISSFSFQWREVLDEDEVKREHFGGDGFDDIVRDIEDAITARASFSLVRDELGAYIVVGQKWRFDFLLQLDGWKVAGMKRIAP